MRIDLRAVWSALVVGLVLLSSQLAVADEACQNCNQGGGAAAGGHAHLIGGPGYHGQVGQYGYYCHDGQCVYRQYGQPDLFYNYYTQANCNAAPAKLYVSPLPVPAAVGHTYITYQPLMPHELMYKHSRNYHRYYDNGQGFSRTSVRYW